MRFLVDCCAGRRLAEWLRNEGHDVFDAGELEHDPGDMTAEVICDHREALARQALITIRGSRVRITYPRVS